MRGGDGRSEVGPAGKKEPTGPAAAVDKTFSGVRPHQVLSLPPPDARFPGTPRPGSTSACGSARVPAGPGEPGAGPVPQRARHRHRDRAAAAVAGAFGGRRRGVTTRAARPRHRDRPPGRPRSRRSPPAVSGCFRPPRGERAAVAPASRTKTLPRRGLRGLLALSFRRDTWRHLPDVLLVPLVASLVRVLQPLMTSSQESGNQGLGPLTFFPELVVAAVAGPAFERMRPARSRCTSSPVSWSSSVLRCRGPRPFCRGGRADHRAAAGHRTPVRGG